MEIVKNLATTENISINVDASLAEVLDVIVKTKHGFLILEKDNFPKGVITEREILKITFENSDHNTPIKKYISLSSPVTVNKNRSCEYALHVLLDNGIRRAIVVNDNGTIYGIVSQETLISHLENHAFKTNMVVKNFVHEYQSLITTPTTTSLENCLRIMFEKRIGSIVIVDKHNIPIGIFTERDGVKLKYKNISFDEPVKEYMTTPLITVDNTLFLQDTIKLMHEKGINRVLINNDKGIPSNLISMRDIAKSLQGSYEQLLEGKLKTLKNSLNYIGESIFEVYEDKGKFIIQWMNQKAIDTIGNYIDTNITELIDMQVWNLIYNNLRHTSIINNYKLRIKNKYFEISCSNHFISRKETLLFVLKDITSSQNEIKIHKEKNITLKHEITMLEQIINTQQNIIFIANKDQVFHANKAFLNFFNKKTLDEFQKSIPSIASKFIKHEHYYSLKTPDENWIESLLALTEKNRIITLIDPNSFDPKVFLVNLVKIEGFEDKYLISLEDISQTAFDDSKFYYNATHDTMTAAYNRSFFYHALKDEIGRAKRYHSTFSLIRVNIDNLNAINEEYGYIDGDKVIETVVNEILKNIRTTDILARYCSGDFILMLPETSGNKCELICQNLKNAMESIDCHLDIKVTLSYGITQFHTIDNEQTILERTKKALLEAKENGKNCFIKL